MLEHMYIDILCIEYEEIYFFFDLIIQTAQFDASFFIIVLKITYFFRFLFW